MSVVTINTQEAFEILNNDKNSLLVDVRSFEEANFSGVVHPSQLDDRVVIVPWKTSETMQANPKFSESLSYFISKVFARESDKTKVIFICRSGEISGSAAENFSSSKYPCYIVKHGFEGDMNEKRQRGLVNGWKADNLPWIHSS